ncbi:MAG TPA: GDSL-type esterase/lipase family protein [Alphaproteobacteria bacterium]|jgi:lysophospholipase L1-like esterase
MTELRICFFGDSLTHGTRDDTTLGWPGRLCAKAVSRGHDVTLYNLGIRRDTSADIARRWQAEAVARLPSPKTCALVFSFGVNDMACDEGSLFRVTPADSHKNAREIVAAASGRWPVLWVSPAPIGRNDTVNCALWSLEADYQDKRAAQLTQDYARIAAELNVPFLDVFTPLSRSRIWRWSLARGGDGVHPSARGYALMAKLVERWPAWKTWFQ